MRVCAVMLFALSAAALLAPDPPPPTFEVATVRPHRRSDSRYARDVGTAADHGQTLTARHTMLIEIIRRAFGVVEQELVGGPAWIREQRFDIVGKSAGPANRRGSSYC